MKRLDLLAEARIRDWRREGRKPRNPSPPQASNADQPLEVRLWNQILELRRQSKSAANSEQAALTKKAAELETQLLVLLETTGRPLAARRVAEALRSIAAYPSNQTH